jgi:hypothetical protein
MWTLFSWGQCGPCVALCRKRIWRISMGFNKLVVWSWNRKKIGKMCGVTLERRE